MRRRVTLLLASLGFIAAIAAAAGAVRYITAVPGTPHDGPLPPLESQEAETAARLKAHVVAIASKPHNVEHYDELEKAARYIESELTALGYTPISQPYEVHGRTVRNIEAVIEPSDPAKSRGTLVIGAHYDSYGDAPGANDNGTGAAAALELARLLADLRGKTDTRIRLVLFTNEEPPYFQTSDMGSYRYARSLAQRREPVIGMISLETLGSFSDEPGSQRYPPTLGNRVCRRNAPINSCIHARGCRN
jgi:Zn-dependent M28 family amino/carboxypeptidase